MLTFTAALSFAQFPDPGPEQGGMPANNYPLIKPYGRFALPFDVVDLPGFQIVKTNSQGQVVGPCSYCSWRVEITHPFKTGYHSHEGGSNVRPEAFVIGSTVGVADANGRPGDIQVQLNGYAGYTVVEVIPTDASMPGSPAGNKGGVNLYSAAYSWNNTTKVMSPFEEFYNDETFVWSLDFFLDQRHPRKSFFVKKGLAGRLEDASEVYNMATQRMSGGPDKPHFTRMSLPHGGIADNDYMGFGPGVHTDPGPFKDPRMMEFHDRGIEFDANNPGLYLGTNYGDAFFAAFYANNCLPGKYTPDGNRLPTANNGVVTYWKAEPTVHFTCGLAPTPFRSPR